MLTFEVGQRYARADVKERAGIGRDAKGGPWDTGIVEHDGEFVIFASVGIPGRTGHDYENRWEGELLHWSHQERSETSWPSVQKLLQEHRVVHVFWRASLRENFVYAGRAKLISYQPTSPVEFLWGFSEEYSPKPPSNHPNEGPDLQQLANDLLWDSVKELQGIVRGLEDKGQVIFQGPPGTGKTYVAKTIAKWLTQADDGHEIVQFHPSYTYEDFVEGFRPYVTDAGQAAYKLEKGPLLRMAEKAQARPDEKFILVIDEINRGNLAKILGELYFLLEYRDEPVKLQYSHEEWFRLPENLWFIGTMNTTDRSIALVDAALRRRFYFFGFYPNEEPISGLLRRWLEKHNPDALWVDNLLKTANAQLGDRHVQIGPSYFMKKDLRLDQETVKFIWEQAVLPYLEEQFFDNADRLEGFRYASLKAEIGSGSNTPSADDNLPEVDMTNSDGELVDGERDASS